jgi:hypothetical protein
VALALADLLESRLECSEFEVTDALAVLLATFRQAARDSQWKNAGREQDASEFTEELLSLLKRECEVAGIALDPVTTFFQDRGGFVCQK